MHSVAARGVVAALLQRSHGASYVSDTSAGIGSGTSAASLHLAARGAPPAQQGQVARLCSAINWNTIVFEIRVTAGWGPGAGGRGPRRE